MRNDRLLNDNWFFSKSPEAGPGQQPRDSEPVTLPHTWNAKDGTDGGNDYFRGACWYYRQLSCPQQEGETWLEVRGAALQAQVWLNGQLLASHPNGYSTFRVNLTPALQQDNLLAIRVDNSKTRTVYPQKADFTFYGGLYREVHLITVPAEHFVLDHFGGPGLKVTPQLDRDLRTAQVTVEAWVTGGDSVSFQVGQQRQTVPVREGYASTTFRLDPVHLWDGRRDPYLYTALAELPSGDRVSLRFGCRRMEVDPDRGFFLNGHPYRLCGAARHQDRADLGNALTLAQHAQDIDLMLEMGCNTVRLAHYQQAQEVYDLCDEKGLVVWAEIPYITEHMPEANDNTRLQLTELVVQNHHHPSIFCWCLSNEITAAGGINPDMVANHQALNELCHRLDPTRPTTMAHAFMLDPADSFVRLADLRCYNLYYGWYLGELEQNEQFLDDFHKQYPTLAIGLSEYGADANPAYQNEHPAKGDWSEGYQCLYHEHMLAIWEARPYLWTMYAWNMFDFAADGRDEGGKPGQNQKGLVTFDRKIKKDAFYLYKAYLSDDPFLHLCGRRYRDRTGEETEIKVYSNQPSVTLWVDGEERQTLTGHCVFRFRIPLTAEHQIEAHSGALSDAMTIRKVDTPNPDYRYGGKNAVNWFDREDEILREGYFSIRDSMESVRAVPAADAVIRELLEPALMKMAASYGEVAQNVSVPESMQKMMNRMSIEGWMKQAARFVTPELVHRINHALNQIPKP